MKARNSFPIALGVAAWLALPSLARAQVDQSCSAVSTDADSNLRDLLYNGSLESDQIHGWFDGRFLPENWDDWMQWGSRTNAVLNVYGKTVLGGWMSANSIDFDSPTLIGFALPFHSNRDYLAVAQAVKTVTHDGLDYGHNKSYSRWGLYSFGGRPEIGRDHIDEYCPLYDGTKWSADPTLRGSSMVHEGWHGWEEERDIFNHDIYPLEAGDEGWPGLSPMPGDSFHYADPDPSNGPTDTDGCTNSPNGPCDVYSWHPDGTPAGQMHTKLHSAYQAEVEFDCDVVDRPSPYIQLITRSVAASEASKKANNFFVNGPAPLCGTPTPIIGFNPLPTCSTPQTSCTVDSDCAADHPGDICSGGCCTTPVLVPQPGVCDTQSCTSTSDCQANFPGYTCLTVDANGESAQCCVAFIH